MNIFRRQLLAVVGLAVSGLVLVACDGSANSAPAGRSAHSTTAVLASTAVASTPTVARSSEAGESRVIGPDGYGGLSLGMSGEQALRTGIVVADAPLPEPCGYYRFRTSQPGSTDVMVSRKLGIVLITVPEHVRTPEGVGTGSPKSDLRAAYPNIGFDGSGTVASTDVPSRRNAVYRFQLDVDGLVNTVGIQTTDGDCAG